MLTVACPDGAQTSTLLVLFLRLTVLWTFGVSVSPSTNYKTTTTLSNKNDHVSPTMSTNKTCVENKIALSMSIFSTCRSAPTVDDALAIAHTLLRSLWHASGLGLGDGKVSVTFTIVHSCHVGFCAFGINVL